MKSTILSAEEGGNAPTKYIFVIVRYLLYLLTPRLNNMNLICLNFCLVKTKESHHNAKSTKRPQKHRKQNHSSVIKTSLINTNPVSSVKIKSSSQLAPSDEDGEDVTSNDTVPVSNETEADLIVNETGPSYIDLKDAFSANTTQELKEIPKIIEDGSLNGGDNATFVGRKYSSATKESKEPILIGKDYSNEMKEKERPEVIHFLGKTQMNYARFNKTKYFGNSSRLAVNKDHLKPIRLRNSLNKTSNIHTHSMKTIANPSLFDRGSEFNPFSENEAAKTTSIKLGSILQHNRSNDLSSKKATVINEKLKSRSDVHFAKVLKRMERMLRKSRISRHNDLLNLRKLVHNLGHLTRNKPSLGIDINHLMLNASAGVGGRLSSIEKRMHIAEGNAVLNNITTVLVQLLENIRNSDGKVNSTTKHAENVNNVAHESHGYGEHHYEMGVMAQKIKHFEKVFQAHLKKEKLAKCEEASSVLSHMSLSGGFDSVKHFSHGMVKDMDHCIELCCSNKRCDLAILENSECYGVDCKHQKCLLGPVIKPSAESNVALLTKRISANIGFTGTPMGSSSMGKCEVQPHVIRDSVLGQGGLKGNATVLEHVTDAWPCGMECCKVNSCNVAMIQEGACYIVSCLSDGPCFEFEHSPGQKTSLVFVQRSKSKPPVLQPSLRVSSLNVKGTTSATTTHVSKSIHQSVPLSSIQTSRPTSSYLHSSPAAIKEFYTANHSYYQKRPTKNPDRTDPHLNVPLHYSESSYSREIQSLTNNYNHPNNCVRMFPLSNVTFRAGFSAGNYKFLGKFHNASACLDHCCRSKDCNVAFVLQKMCFLVTCSSNKLCQNEPLLSNQFQSSMFYVARSPLEADMIKKELVPTIKRKISNSSKKSKIDEKYERVKPKANFTKALNIQHGCTVGFVASNAKFLHGFESGEIFVIGKLEGGISDCVSKCCAYNGCNASLTVGIQCFLVKCYSKESCQIVESDSNIETSVATVIRRPDEKPFSYLLPQQPVKETSSLVPTSSKELKQNISLGKIHTENTVKHPHTQQFSYHSSERNIAPISAYTKEAIASTPVSTHSGFTTSNIHAFGHISPVSIVQPSSVANKVNGQDSSRGSRGHDQSDVVNESNPQNNNSLVNSEMLKKIQESLNNLLQANKKTNKAAIVNNEIPRVSKSDFVTDGIANHSMTSFPVNAALLKNVGARLGSPVHNTESTVFRDRSESPNQERKMESKQKSEILGKMFSDNQHEMADLSKATLEDVFSKIKNVSRQQAQLIKNIPKLNQVIGKIQQHLENESRLVDTESSKLERKNFIVQNNDVNNSSILDLPKASVQSSLSQGENISSKHTTVMPTPKLLQSPIALVTTPSLVSVQKVQSTNHMASTVRTFSASVSDNSKHRNEKPGIGKQIVKVMQSAGVIPVKQEQTNPLTNLLSTKASVVKKTSKFVKNEMPRMKSTGRSSIVPAAQHLLNFLEAEMKRRTANFENAKRLESIAKSTEDLKYGERVNGLVDEKHVLNQRIKNLESVIHHLKSSTSSAHPNKSKVQSTINVKESRGFNEASSRKENKALSAEDNQSFLLQQLKSIVRSELAHNSQIVSPTSANTLSMITKQIHDRSDARKHEVILEGNLHRLYNHAVAEMKKALESSGKRENEDEWSGGDHFTHENIRKNHINSKQDKGSPHAHKQVSSPVSKSSPKFVEIALKTSNNRTNGTNVLFGISGSRNDDETGDIKVSSEHMVEHPGTSVPQQSLGSSSRGSMAHKDSNHNRHKLPVVNKVIKEKNSTNVPDGLRKATTPTINSDQSLSSKGTAVMNDKTSTCHHGSIQHDMTLKGGIAKEGVEDAGIVVDIDECIGLCCRSTSCNIAFMLKNNCFLLPCTDAQLCQAVKLPTESLHTRLAIVSRGSNANRELKIFDDVVEALELSSPSKVRKLSEDSQIKKSEFPSVKTDVTDMKNKKNEHKKSFSATDNSNTVQALLDEMNKLTSQTGSAENGSEKKTDFDKKMLEAHDTKPNLNAKSNEDNSPSSQRPKLCPYGEVEYNTTIEGGLAAANYRYGGKVTNINECVEMCCESDSCNIAFLFSDECFLLMCKSESQCKSIPVASTEVSPHMVRLLRTNAEKNYRKLTEPVEVLKEVLNSKKSITTKSDQDGKHKDDSLSSCMKSDPLLQVVPKGRMRPGNFKDFGRVKSMEECAEFCCRWDKCKLAFMVLDGCFGVSCKSHCGVVRSNDLSFQSKVVYVKRRQDVLQWLTSQGTSRSKHENKKGAIVSGNTEDDQSNKLNDKMKTVAKSASTKSSNAHNSLTSKKAYKSPLDTKRLSTTKVSRLRTNALDKSTISKNKRGDGIKPQINVKAAVEPKAMSRDDGKRLCFPGVVEHDVTLGGGINAGSYTEQGEVLNMHECVKWCCQDKGCDVAMVIKGICYTVSCYDQRKCDSVPVRRIQYHPRLVRVKRVKRGVRNDAFYGTRSNTHVSPYKIVEESSRTPGIPRSSFDDAYGDENSEVEDELLDLLTEQSSKESGRLLPQKGEKMHMLDAFYKPKQTVDNIAMKTS